MPETLLHILSISGPATSLLAAANPIDHVVDKPLVKAGDVWVISNATLMLVTAAILTGWIMIAAAKRIRTGEARSVDDFRAQGVFANLIESVCLYLRNDVFKEVLGKQTDKYTPMLWTLFWFILICNLLGMVPLKDFTAMFGLGYHGHGIGGTATQSIWVTSALALTAFVFYIGAALIKDPVAFFAHMTGGAPWFMWPIMVPVEILGTFVKPFALAVRLFANMTAGHLVIAVMLGFVASLAEWGGGGYALTPLPMLGALAINFLEVLVSLIQAFVFTFLTCLFLGQLVVHEHDEEHEHVEHHTADAKGGHGDAALSAAGPAEATH